MVNGGLINFDQLIWRGSVISHSHRPGSRLPASQLPSSLLQVQVSEGNRIALSDSLSIVRNLARTELDTAGTGESSVMSDIPTEDELRDKLIRPDSGE